MKNVNIFGLLEMSNADFLIVLFSVLCFALLNLIVIFTLNLINTKEFKISKISFKPEKEMK